MPFTQLDHIVLLLPYSDLINLPVWLTNEFTITPGGTHGDGKTVNKLIVFKDGSYIELIAFVEDKLEHQQGHWWDPVEKGYGIIDYAFSMKGGSDEFEALREKVEKLDIPVAWKSQSLRSGGRENADGEKIEWTVSFPQASARGKAPFWCFDVTPRERRVTVDDASTTHPSGVRGVHSLLIFHEGRSSEMKSLQSLLDVIVPQSANNRLDEFTWDIGTARPLGGDLPPQICVMEAKQEYEKTTLQKGRGLVARVTLLTDEAAGGAQRRRIHENVKDDQVSIGFIGLQ